MDLVNIQHQDKIRPILLDMDWLKAFIDFRIKKYFDASVAMPDNLMDLPDLSEDQTPYGLFIQRHQLTFEERIALVVSLVTQIQPQLFDCFFIQNSSIGRQFSEFGGIELKGHRGFVPTVETLCFILYGTQYELRPHLYQVFAEHHVFHTHKVIELKKHHDSDTFWSSALKINEGFFYQLITGEEIQPKYSAEFPAKRLETNLDFEDLVLHPQLKEELVHMLTWLKHKEEIQQDKALKRNFKTGYRALFYGPPGTGKSLTASMLGKMSGLPVFRIDLSKVVSKYIGETEKNLSNLMDIAEHKKWILFFDEADSLFSKRTEINDSKDKYANQGTSFLLQRLEEFDGMVVLASNLKPNIDRAFVRRFQSILFFNIPSPSERLVLWKNSLRGIEYSNEINLKKFAEKYEVTGAAICNAIQFAWLNVKKNEQSKISANDIEAGLLREIAKEGKTVKD
jgi:AAA+ superfamily predicted ATPase